MLVSQAEFARMEGKAKSYITALKQAGRLVMNGDKVDVEASREKIAGTADPNRDDVQQRWAEQRPQPAAVNELQADKIGSSYQTARAVKEKYAAMQAKLEYERAIGKLVEKSDVDAAVADVVTLFRQRLENIPYRFAPELVSKDLDTIRAILKQEVHGALAELEQELTRQLNAQEDIE